MHLFAGVGGGLLADLILGHTPIVAVEWDKYACEVLRQRSKDGWFPDLQVYEGDVRLFDPSEYAERVDCIHAGFPCQDISNAGKQAGVEEGTRSGLYREVLRIAGVVRPRFIFLENVSAILSIGLGTVLGDLASRGYDARWLCIKASDVGANHRRDRWFLLAYTRCLSNESKRVSGISVKTKSSMQGETWEQWVRSKVTDSSENVAYTSSIGQSRQGEYVGQVNTETDSDRKADWAIDCSEGREGWWKSEPNVGRVADGDSARIHRLKGLGNAQVPLQAAVAFKLLSEGL